MPSMRYQLRETRTWSFGPGGWGGAASAVKAMVRPSGDRSNVPTPWGRSVSCSASPPSSAMRYTCCTSERVERKKTDLPSGANRGVESSPASPVRRRGRPPRVETCHSEVAWRSSSPLPWVSDST